MSSDSGSSGEDEQRVSLLSNNMEARAEHQVTKRFQLYYGLATALGSVLVVLTVIWTFGYRGGLAWSSDPNLQFNWHPLLMVIGLIYSYAQSMLIYRSLRNKQKKQLKLLHALLHCTTFVLAVIALIAVFDFHNLSTPPKPNLYSLHSWLGLSTVILFSMQLLIGFVSFLYPGLSKELRATLLPVHVSFGAVIFLFAVVTAMMGLLEKAIFQLDKTYGSLPPEGLLINFMGIILVCFGALVLYLVNEHAFKRISLPDDEIVLTRASE